MEFFGGRGATGTDEGGGVDVWRKTLAQQLLLRSKSYAGLQAREQVAWVRRRNYGSEFG